MAETHVLIGVLVQSAANLPKMDLFSETDPFVVVYWDNKTAKRTTTIENEANPVWNESLYLPVVCQGTEPGGTLHFTVGDEDVTTVESVARGSLSLGVHQDVDIGLQLLEKVKPSPAGPPTLRVSLSYVLALRDLYDRVGETPGAFCDEERRFVVAPVPKVDPAACLAIEYDSNGTRLSISLMFTEAMVPSPPFDLVWSTPQPHPAVKYDLTDQPLSIGPHMFFHQTTVRDIPLHVDLSHLLVTSAPGGGERWPLTQLIPLLG